MKPIKTLQDEYINANMLGFVAPDETVEDAERFFLTPINKK